MNPKIMI